MKTYVNKSDKEKGALATMYYTLQQVRDITRDAGDTGYLLMTIYAGIATKGNPNMEDAQLAKMTGKAESTIRDTRLKLTKTGWFKRTKQTVKGEVHVMYDLGQHANDISFTTRVGVHPPKPTKEEETEQLKMRKVVMEELGETDYDVVIEKYSLVEINDAYNARVLRDFDEAAKQKE